MSRGLFVVLEGIDGAGKSEQCSRLAARLRALAPERENGGVVEVADSRFGSWGAAARAWARGQLPDVVDPEFALGCFVLDRFHLSKFVAATLLRPQHVICDRWDPSTWAYQIASGMPARQVASWLDTFPPAVKPDLTLWLRVHPAYAMERVNRAHVERLRPELRQRYESVEFLALVDEHYAKLPNLVAIDGEDDPDAVTEALFARVWEALQRRGYFRGRVS